MAIRRADDSVTLTGGGEKLLVATLLSVFPLLGLAGVIDGRGPGDRIFGAILLVGGGYLVARWIRVRVRATPDALLIRGFLRNYRLGWTGIEEAVLVPANPGNPIWAIIAVQTSTRKRIKIDGLGNRLVRDGDMSNTPVGLMAAEINRRVQRT